jgi:hypothetical protein
MVVSQGSTKLTIIIHQAHELSSIGLLGHSFLIHYKQTARFMWDSQGILGPNKGNQEKQS